MRKDFQIFLSYAAALASLVSLTPANAQFATGSSGGGVGIPQYLLPIVRSTQILDTSRLLAESEDADAETFKMDVLGAKGTVVVEWMSPDCPACAPVRPVIEQVASQYAGKVNIVRINIHTNPFLTYKYGIRRVPAVTVFTEGKPIERLALFNPSKKHELSAVIERHL